MHSKHNPINALSTDRKLNTSMIVNGEKERKFIFTNNLRERIEELERQNYDLAVQLHGIKTEKQNVLDDQREKISHYISEFNIFRKELDQVIYYRL